MPFSFILCDAAESKCKGHEATWFRCSFSGTNNNQCVPLPRINQSNEGDQSGARSSYVHREIGRTQWTRLTEHHTGPAAFYQAAGGDRWGGHRPHAHCRGVGPACSGSDGPAHVLYCLPALPLFPNHTRIKILTTLAGHTNPTTYNRSSSYHAFMLS